MWRCSLFISAMLYGSLAGAWETDQYTLPDQPIAETGEEVSRFIYASLQKSLYLAKQYRLTYSDQVKQIEMQIADKQQSLNKMNRFVSQVQMIGAIEQSNNQINQLQASLQHHLAHGENYYQTAEGMASLVSETLGSVISSAEMQDAIWGGITELTPYSSGVKAHQAVVFDPGKLGSIYAYAGFHRLLHPSHFVLSSTIKLYGIEIGMDKLGHIFNEGFQYYQKFNQEKNRGESDTVAIENSVSWGIDTENTYYGRWVSGIYSNADLASNYVGLHFYFNLFSPLTINGVNYPAILLQNKQGDYYVNPEPVNQPNHLLTRFISYHMNEALNPSSLEYLQYIVVKEAVKNRCPSWRSKYPLPSVLNEKATHLDRWNGSDYGFDATNTISIYNRCFIEVSEQSNQL